MKQLFCIIFKHKYKLNSRANGNYWGWNIYKCSRCGKKEDSLI